MDKSGGPDACWPWTARRNKKGYGQFGLRRKITHAHRVAWGLANGPILDGLHCLHRCDNPPCVNPAHLFLGTNADNVTDKEAKGRGNQPRGERHGSRTHPERLARGERHGNTRLTEAQVAEIRVAYADGGVLQRELAARFGVSHGTIHNIVRRKTWVSAISFINSDETSR